MPIVLAPLNQKLKVVKIAASDDLKKHLESLGITIGWITILIIVPLFGAPAQENLGVAIITGVVGVLLLYFVKSYFGKRNEEEIKFQKELRNISIEADEEEGE